MKQQVLLALCATSLGLGACGLDVPNLNNPSLESFQERPTPAAIYSASTGLLIGNRAGVSAQAGYVAQLGILGRESFTLDAADPRYVTEMVRGNLDPGSPAFGGSNWANPYANIRNANTLLAALDKVNGVSDAQKEAIQGFAKTIQALDFLVVINTRDTNGAPINVGGLITEPLGEIESKEAVFAHIVTLLEEAKGHLNAGGDAFPFPLSSGYTGFNKPKDFLKFNRALAARVYVYRGDFNAALTALGESFLDTTKPLTLGVYHTFSTGPGDVPNALKNDNIYANPTLRTDADLKANGAIDDRVTRKTASADETKYDDNLKSDLVFTLYDSQSTPVPIIRNEELILLRAEANIGLRNYGPATEDINFIRTTSGGLEPRTDLGEANILDELLKQKRYSLLFEGGHRWIDMRRYGKLDQLDKAGGIIHDKFPLPKSETDARQ